MGSGELMALSYNHAPSEYVPGIIAELPSVPGSMAEEGQFLCEGLALDWSQVAKFSSWIDCRNKRLKCK